ncbi:MAG: BTAD domain-containing putative transcriptional regulator, partial [Candidatus Elarobacter sp.]
YEDALAYAHVVAGVDALSEAACEISMKIHLGSGDADAARREFRRYSAVLAAELGATPTAPLVELARAATA